MFHPLAFANHNDKGQGFGLNSLASVKPGETIVKIKTRMSLTSDNIIDTIKGVSNDNESSEDDELYKALIDHTKKTASLMNPGDPANANRIYQHLNLTQKLIALTRKEFQFTPQANLLKAWFDVLPKHDLSQMIFWDSRALNQIDSQILRQNYQDTLGVYQAYFKMLVQDDASPYRSFVKDSEESPMSLEEFMWAFNIVGSRNLVFNNTPYQPTEDPNAIFMIVPLLDFVNHAYDPNVVALPFHDKVNDESYVLLQAVKEISPGEQLCMSYGHVPNSHLVQKYGFSIHDNPLKQSIVRIPFHDHMGLLYEEAQIKKEIAIQCQIPINPEQLTSVLYNDRMDGSMLRQLRLSFLTSQSIINLGGGEAMRQKDFKQPIDT